MRRAAKRDGNHKAIADALRDAGCGVVDLAAVGCGVPDLLIHAPTYPFQMALIEIKNPDVPKCDRRLTPAQREFHMNWRRPIFVAESVEEALAAVGIVR